jgi:LysM repeat protein
MNQRTRRSPARFLAPLALIAVLVTFAAIISSSGGSDSGGATTTSESSPAKSGAGTSKTTAAKTKTTARKKAAAKSYTVQAGDSFGTIAAKTGITVEQLQALNPSADSTRLQTGQKLRVK